MVEIATVGGKGWLAFPPYWMGMPATAAAMVQGATETCYRMGVDAFRREIDRRGAFHELMAR